MSQNREPNLGRRMGLRRCDAASALKTRPYAKLIDTPGSA